jgi:hypothetical protein
VNEPDRGIFVDQKFMDLVPGFADGARILRNTAYNAAYWNLHQRTLGGAPGQWLMDGAPLRFFHFSGIDPTNLRRLSKHTEAFCDETLPPLLGELMRAYADQVLANGHGRVPNATYAYGRFSSGTPIPEMVRRMFRERHVRWSGGDPFETYEEYLQLPCAHSGASNSGYVTHLMASLHQREPWLRSTFDLTARQGVEGYIDWYIRHARNLLKDSRLIDPVALRAGQTSAPPGTRRRAEKCDAAAPDVSVVGYLRLALGVGEAGRQILRTLRHAGFNARGMPISLNSMSAAVDHSLEPLFDDSTEAPVQVFNVNADQLPAVISHMGSALRQDAYRAVMPFWELEDFPAPWLQAFDLVDEVWRRPASSRPCWHAGSTSLCCTCLCRWRSMHRLASSGRTSDYPRTPSCSSSRSTFFRSWNARTPWPLCERTARLFAMAARTTRPRSSSRRSTPKSCRSRAARCARRCAATRMSC